MSNDESLALLVDRFLDGELSIDERRKLAADPEMTQRFITELRFQGRVSGLLRQDGRELLGHVEDALDLGSSTGLVDRVLARLPVRRGQAWWRWIAVSALAAGLAVVVGLMLMPVTGSPTGVVAAVADGINPTSARVDFHQGTLLTLNVNQEAQVAFKDGTRMDLGATSAIRLSGIDQGGARIALENGSLSAEVSKQPSGSHFQVATGDALLTVLGTKFTVTKYPWGTRVEVTEGRVRTRREADGYEVEVGAGNRVDVAPGVMTLQPIRPPLPPKALMLEPIADSVVVGGKYGDENRGKRASHVVTSPCTKAEERRDYYLRFDLRQVSKAPTRAELHLHLNLLKSMGLKLHLSRVDQPWDETHITWNNRPPRGTLVASWTPDRADSAIDLTQAIATAITTNPNGTLGLCLFIDEAENADAIVGFHTREAPALLRPRLVIEP
ncbi:MAG TPA: DNRLRE domain-containing protein [Planctomycetota bacterium]|nr:DNRLRE domain-containing protein [Planctomycetota bacterium]